MRVVESQTQELSVGEQSSFQNYSASRKVPFLTTLEEDYFRSRRDNGQRRIVE